MATKRNPLIEQKFPGLAGTTYEITSPVDPAYNCIAWVTGDASRWWEPDRWDIYYWPEEAPRAYDVAAYRAAFETLGFVEDKTETYIRGIERIALFSKGNTPTHAARQLNEYQWTSKLGKGEDMTHPLRALYGELYGEVALIMSRPVQATKHRHAAKKR